MKSGASLNPWDFSRLLGTQLEITAVPARSICARGGNWPPWLRAVSTPDSQVPSCLTEHSNLLILLQPCLIR
jgi:hypothetical protein